MARQASVPSTWSIARLVPGGDGLARLSDGRIGFARGALPGDRILPSTVVDHQSYVRATAWQLVEASPDRVEPACPVADRCGGCDWMRLGRDAQLSAKAALVREALVRTGGFCDLPQELTIVSAGSQLRYRNRLRLHVASDDRVGLYATGTHEIVEMPGCAVSAAPVERALDEIRSASCRHPGILRAFSEIEIRAAPDGAVSLRLFPRRRERRIGRRVAVLVAELGENYQVLLAGSRERVPAPPQKWPTLGGVTLLVPVESFVQVNWSVNLELVRTVVEGALRRSVSRFCDLYSGAGNFSLPLLAAGLSGVSIERDSAAVDAARSAARVQKLPDAGLLLGDASRLEALVGRDHFDLVLVDPPRRGARDVIPALIALSPRFVAICSCDPVTLARDLALLASHGYALEEVTAFDMFPQTHHVEVLAWMVVERTSNGAPIRNPA